ncbi:DUF3788 domain-containing protein [Abyssisolibacter fermentans]|uniref:DUF3788 domain-containing protein n=1 Tax=Abyssisolibacter fermentans TaxID=1766203 RepID=UPI00083350B1|nr:DUF3788 domain-containing protein [Abyssisolibacter fermentans]
MFERMLNKEKIPSMEEIYETIGNESVLLFEALEEFLKDSYSLSTELRFPFGNNYGWGNKYSHKSKHLCYVFFETGAITVLIQIGKGELSKLNKQISEFIPKTKELWEKRYPCGAGGWINYRVQNTDELEDVKKLLAIKKAPIK